MHPVPDPSHALLCAATSLEPGTGCVSYQMCACLRIVTCHWICSLLDSHDGPHDVHDLMMPVQRWLFLIYLLLFFCHECKCQGSFFHPRELTAL